MVSQPTKNCSPKFLCSAWFLGKHRHVRTAFRQSLQYFALILAGADNYIE